MSWSILLLLLLLSLALLGIEGSTLVAPALVPVQQEVSQDCLWQQGGCENLAVEEDGEGRDVDWEDDGLKEEADEEEEDDDEDESSDEDEDEEEEDWEELSDTWWEQDVNYWDMMDSWDCEEYLFGTENTTPLHDTTLFAALKGIYDDLLGEHSTIRPLTMSHGFAIPFELAYIQGKGRGIIAKENVTAGSLLWSSRGQTACFSSVVMFRKFLSMISSQLACEILIWFYAIDLSVFRSNVGNWTASMWTNIDLETYNDTSSLRVCVELDESALFNDGNFYGDNLYTNTFLALSEDGVSGYYAARDIEYGEEILVDYSLFEFDRAFTLFGL